MQFEVTHIYKRPIVDVFDVLTDFECIRAKYLAVGQTGVELVSREAGKDGSLTIVTRRVVPLDLPGFAKRVLSSKQTVTQTDTWSASDNKGARTGTFAVESKGAPVKVSGALRLVPKGAKGCTNTSTVTIECKLPFIGGKITDFVAGDARRSVDHEQTWISAYLAKH